MANATTATASGQWNLPKVLILAAALVGLGGSWVLYVVAPPVGPSPYGMVVSLLAGAYLAFLVYSYVKYG